MCGPWTSYVYPQPSPHVLHVQISVLNTDPYGHTFVNCVRRLHGATLLVYNKRLRIYSRTYPHFHAPLVFTGRLRVYTYACFAHGVSQITHTTTHTTYLTIRAWHQTTAPTPLMEGWTWSWPRVTIAACVLSAISAVAAVYIAAHVSTQARVWFVYHPLSALVAFTFLAPVSVLVKKIGGLKVWSSYGGWQLAFRCRGGK